MSHQLDIDFLQSLRGSEPVRNRSEPVESSSETDQSSSETAEIINGFAVPNRSRNSSMIQGGPTVSPKGEKESGTDPDQTLLLGERSSANASLLPNGQRGRAGVLSTAGASPVLELRNRSGTGPQPQRLADGHQASEQAGSSPTLRSYQAEAIAAVEREFAEGRKRTLLVLPTGTGKTVVFAELARRRVANAKRVLVLAHRTELLDQAAKKLLDVGLYSSIDQGARKGSRHADVVIGSVQTLRGDRLRRHPRDAFDLVIVDEAHHAAAQSYRTILEWFSAQVLGVTATPDRGDGRALGKCFESVAFTYDMRTAIREKHLAPLRAKRILVEDLDLSQVKTHHGDFDQGELSAKLNDEQALIGVVDPLVREAGDRRTLIFGVDVAHARAIAELLNAKRPGSAMALDGTSKPEERKAVLALFQRGAFQYLCNCALFTEGFDEPSIACVALARPTQSRALYTQMLGRGTRKAPGKTDCLVLDFVGNSGRHRLVGPADALAGTELDDATRKKVEEQLDGQLELEEVLEHAQEQAAADAAMRRARHHSLALATYRSREIDLFLGDTLVAFDRDCAAAQRPATAQQLAEITLAKLGDPPPGLSEAEAQSMLDAVKARRKAGLCSIPQARLLERLGIDTKAMTFGRAGMLITKIKERNAWKMPWIVFGGESEYRRGRKTS